VQYVQKSDKNFYTEEAEKEAGKFVQPLDFPMGFVVQ
jgi:hypothetical protein